MPISEPLPPFDPYETLGVDRAASADQIEAAFRAVAKREHPDMASDPVLATTRMQRINVARQWLCDPDRRERYDRARLPTGARQPAGTRPPAGVRPPIVEPWTPGANHPDGPLARASVWPAIGLVSLMVLLGSLTVGPGMGLVTTVVTIAALVTLAIASLATLLRALA